MQGARCTKWFRVLLMYLKDETGLEAWSYPPFRLSSLPHHHPPQNKMHTGFIRNNQQCSSTAEPHSVHIYISIHGGLAVFNRTSRRQSLSRVYNSWQALQRISTANYAEHAPTSRVLSGQQRLDVTINAQGSV